jgi:quercetin dioxygenase-like cupin family protein
MAFVVRTADRRLQQAGVGVHREWILGPDSLPDGRLTIEILRLEPGAVVEVATGADELAWLQVLSGVVSVDGEDTDADWIVMTAGGRAVSLVARVAAEVFLARVPHAARYDAAVAEGLLARVDWTTEPVLDSEHDARRRIYLASTGLWGTEAVKGEMIVYPPGTSGAAHHHEGAEHFQYMVSGSGTAVLEGEEVELAQGDLLYNLENEEHWFANGTDTDMVFVEFFVPGRSTTVWAPGVNVCGWNPRTTDVKGRTAARELSYHIHGQGDV